MHPAAPIPLQVARWVDAFWRFDGTGEPHRVLPDGCIDFIFDLAAGTATVIGPMTRAEMAAPPRGSRLFAVRFRPGAASAFLGAGANELVDRDAPLDDVAPLAPKELAERIAERKSHADRASVLADFLLSAAARTRGADARVQRALALVERGPGSASIARIASEVGTSERQLERLFRERVGLRPKLVARILRLQRAVKLAEARPTTQARVALGAGFADEPHMVREFRALAGVTLRELRAERRVGFFQAEPVATAK